MPLRKKFGHAVKALFSVLILALQTGAFAFVLFGTYNRVFKAPLATGGDLLVAIYLVILIVTFNILDALKIGYHTRSNIILSQSISVLIVNFVAYLQISLIHRAFVSVLPMLILTLFNVCISVLWTFSASAVINKIFPPKKVILVYGDHQAQDLIYKLVSRTDQYLICESVLLKPDTELFDGNLEEVYEAIKRYEAVVISRVPSKERNDILKFCYVNNIDVYLPPRISDIFIRGAEEIHQFDSPLLFCRNTGLTEEQRIIKRACDIFLSIIGIIVFSPFLAIISLSIKLKDRGPVLFKQKRITINEKVFEIYKFRSMIVDAEKNGEVIPTTDRDPRITKVGRVIRKLRLDELPQLFNILKGDMSVVGPRPERVEHHEMYTKQVPEFKYRTKVKAGLTGFAQIMGKYNTTPYDKLVLDLMYINNFTFFLDFKLILQTIKVMFMKESTEGFEEKKKKETETND